MTKESMEWLNNYTLIGYTKLRGEAWHYQEALQGSELNHYPYAVPVADVERRLFNWEAKTEPVLLRAHGKLDEPLYVKSPDGQFRQVPANKAMFVEEAPGRQAIRASDNGDLFGIFMSGYQAHQYREWLLQKVAILLDDILNIGSAGLLKNRAQAWVSVEMPDNIVTPEGVEFRPNFVAASSFDGSLATTFKPMVTLPVCDNTLAWGLQEDGPTLRVKHTRYSHMNILNARQALGVIHSIEADFEAEVKALCETEVTRQQFDLHLDLMVPLTDKHDELKKKAALTNATKKRDLILGLYTNDKRVAPWAGTAYGVLQAYNTYDHHIKTVKNVSRVQRNRENAINGITARNDAQVLEALELVLAS